jgi:two-component system phosphate regulon response regulator PhoB
MNVLIADDDRAQTLMISSRLRAKGFNLIVAYDAIQAWMAAIRSLPDAIVLDIQMPGRTGVAVLRQLKSSSKTGQIPVIVLSGSTNSNDEAEFKELGADRFLHKPVDLQQLYATLSQVMAKPADPPSAP